MGFDFVCEVVVFCCLGFVLLFILEIICCNEFVFGCWENECERRMDCFGFCLED